MSGPIRARRLAALFAAFALAALAGCAPKRVSLPPLEPLAARARYEQALVRRDQASASALCDVDVRVEGRSVGKLPRFEMRAAMASPDRVRLRASWLLGTAFDLCALGDSVQAVVPSRHRGVVVAGDSPIGPPAARFRTAVLALWRPDSAAWAGLVPDSTGGTVTWLDSGDTLRLTLDREARPVVLAWRTGEGPIVRARYDGWQSASGVEIPHRVSIADDRGAVRAQFEVSGFEPRPVSDPEWFALELPERTEHVAWGDLGRWIAKAAELW